MGNCALPCIQDRKSKYHFKVDKYDQIPEDTEKFRTVSPIKHPFSAILASLKIKKCPYKSISVKISIDDEEYYKLGMKPVGGLQDVKWKFQKRLDFIKTDYEIRCSFLVVQVIDESQNTVATLKINLYIICTGPYHQDFLLKFKNGKFGRISFDFKVSQLIEVSLQSIETQINLLKKHPGENFAFLIKTIVGNDTKLSKPSYPVQVMLDQNSSSKTIQNQINLTHSRKRSKNNLPEVKELKQGNNLVWRKSVCQQMPSISMKILLNQLHHSYFQILLIKYSQTIEKTPEPQCQERVTIKQELFAECFISFHKMFSKQPEIFVKDSAPFQRRLVGVQEKMEIHGRQFGQAKLSFYLENEKYIRQMQVCVRTEEGVSKTSPVFQIDDYGEDSCKQLKQLKQLNEEIELMIIKLEQCEESYMQMKRLKSQIQLYLSQMLPILQKTSKESMILYSYANPKQLIEGQKILIEIGQKIANYVEEEDEVIGQLCWLILIALIKRGEFRLSNIGFNQRQRQQINNKKPSKITKRKIAVALMYQQLLYKLLKIALTSLNWKGSESQRAFAEIFCSYAYFRIPEFRNEMLNVISIQTEEDVPQWKGIEFSQNQQVDYTILREEVNSFTALFDWEHGFHKCLQKTIKTEEKTENSDKNSQKAEQLDLMQILSNENWKYRFQRRGPAFFSFIKYWISYVQGLIIKSKDIQWKYFPGYNKLLKVFFLQLKRRNILEYSQSLKQTARRLIANEKIFSIIIYILFNKANIYEPLSVIKVIEMISDLLLTLKLKNKSISAFFHYAHFFNAIQIIIDSEFLFMIETTMIMLYTHYDMFHWEFRKHLCIYLLKKVFFKLFFHWSPNVRNVFHHLLIYRISCEINSQILKERDFTQIKKHEAVILQQAQIMKMKQHYDTTMNQLHLIINQRVIKSKYQSKIKRQDKNLYLTMKRKLIQRKLSEAKKKLLQPMTISEITMQFPQSDNQNNIAALQKHRKLFLQQKASYDERFVQFPRLDRTQSQIIHQNKVSVVYKNCKLNKKQQEVIELNKENSIKIKNQILDTTQIRDDLNSIDLKIGKNKFLSEFNPIFNVFESPSCTFQNIQNNSSKSLKLKSITLIYPSPTLRKSKKFIKRIYLTPNMNPLKSKGKKFLLIKGKLDLKKLTIGEYFQTKTGMVRLAKKKISKFSNQQKKTFIMRIILNQMHFNKLSVSNKIMTLKEISQIRLNYQRLKNSFESLI